MHTRAQLSAGPLVPVAAVQARLEPLERLVVDVGLVVGPGHEQPDRHAAPLGAQQGVSVPSRVRKFQVRILISLSRGEELIARMILWKIARLVAPVAERGC